MGTTWRTVRWHGPILQPKPTAGGPIFSSAQLALAFGPFFHYSNFGLNPTVVEFVWLSFNFLLKRRREATRFCAKKLK
jgi:hypothetical protein